MKKIILFAVAAFCIAGSKVLAAPLADYSLGKFSVQVGVNTLNDFKNIISGSELSLITEQTVKGGEKTKPYASFTAGIGSGFALQYKYEKMKGTPSVEVNSASKDMTTDVMANEYNLRYALDESLSVYIGDYRTKCTGDIRDVTDPVYNDKSKDHFQAGVTMVVPFTDKITLWGDCGIGTNIQHYELGLCYKVSQKVGLDFSYKYLKLDKLGELVGSDVTDFTINGKTRGIRIGLSFNF